MWLKCHTEKKIGDYMLIFVLIICMYTITILAIRTVIKEYKREIEKDKEYYKNL